MEKVFKVKVMVALLVMSCLFIGGVTANAGITTFQIPLPANGAHVRTTSALYKTTGDDYSYINPRAGIGNNLTLKCRTVCKLGTGEVVYSNPETVVLKGENRYLGVFIDLNLQPNQAVWLDQWSSVSGVADTAYTQWDFR